MFGVSAPLSLRETVRALGGWGLQRDHGIESRSGRGFNTIPSAKHPAHWSNCSSFDSLNSNPVFPHVKMLERIFCPPSATCAPRQLFSEAKLPQQTNSVSEFKSVLQKKQTVTPSNHFEMTEKLQLAGIFRVVMICFKHKHDVKDGGWRRNFFLILHKRSRFPTFLKKDSISTVHISLDQQLKHHKSTVSVTGNYTEAEFSVLRLLRWLHDITLVKIGFSGGVLLNYHHIYRNESPNSPGWSFDQRSRSSSSSC